ncbi:carbohydrate ABC transporter permease [Paenibacillus solisilvae]|uniref:Carbohydrate ABC transporter permease n=1 Tax=Paenibacillus solisilvae TaxID=2486751 RepID=A0ABW0VWP5_9BACL
MKNRSDAFGIGSKLFDWSNYLLMGLLIVVALFPFLNVLAVSLNQAVDTARGGIYLWPRQFTWLNYKSVFNDRIIYHAALISVLRTAVGTILSVFCTAMLAYTISRKEYVFRKFITILFVITMYFNGGLIPNYLLIRHLHMTNSFWVYIVPGIVGAFNLIVIRSFINGLPGSLIESARMDGAGEFRTFIKIVLPLCMPVIATVSLFVAVGQWNNWFDTFLYNSSNLNLSTLQYELMKKLQSASLSVSADSAFVRGSDNKIVVTPNSIRAAITLVATVPIMLVYPFLQKYFVAGMTLGGVKE